MSETDSMSSDSGGHIAKTIGLAGVAAIAAGSMISSGLFILPAIAYRTAGPSMVLAYALAGILVIPVLLDKAELATAMPMSGGSYFHIERSLGPFVGTVAGFTGWLSILLKAAFAFVGLGAVTGALLPQMGAGTVKLTALSACLLIGAINLFGARHALRLQAVLVGVLIVVLGGFVASGIGGVHAARFEPFMSKGARPFFQVVGLVFIAYGGLTKVAGVAGEVKNPTRNLSKGMMLAFLAVGLLYVTVTFVVVGVLEPKAISASLAPVAAAARRTVGAWGAIVVNLAAAWAFIAAGNSGILSASRIPAAMSKDGLVPAALSRSIRRTGTPLPALLATIITIAVVIVFLDIESLVKVASTMMLLTFTLVSLSNIILRTSGLQNYRPTFEAPLFPWLQIATVIIYFLLILEMGRFPLLFTLVFCAAAAVWYVLYAHRRIDRESAFVYMVKQIISRDIERSRLEDELKQIAIERDEISHDRFDHLVKDAVILDIQEKLSPKEFFRKVAGDMADKQRSFESNYLYEQLLKREKESSTIVRPGVAIPHVIVEGDHEFDLALVRAREGIVFDELHPPVKIAFVIIGSIDERNFHMRTLVTISHVIAEEGFEERWMKARGPEELRDVVLLSDRQRDPS